MIQINKNAETIKQTKMKKDDVFGLLKYFMCLYKTVSSAAPQIPLCRRILGFISLDLHSLFWLLCTAVLIGCDPATSPLPPAFGSYTRAPLVSLDRQQWIQI
jgi:hypothetical protein